MDERVKFCNQTDRITLLLDFLLDGEVRHNWGLDTVFEKRFCIPCSYIFKCNIIICEIDDVL